jgi:F-type H+-transporting ATPase subunit alpha
MIIFAVTNGYLDEVPVENVAKWEADFHRFMRTNYSEIGDEIVREKRLSDELMEKLRAAIDDFKRTSGA